MREQSVKGESDEGSDNDNDNEYSDDSDGGNGDYDNSQWNKFKAHSKIQYQKMKTVKYENTYWKKFYDEEIDMQTKIKCREKKGFELKESFAA